MDLKLKGKSVLITGASKGIGRATAFAFAAEGCDLKLTARSKDLLSEIKTDIAAQHNTEVEIFGMDLTDPRELNRLADQSANIDILINNAGVVPSGPLHSIDEKAWRDGWELKLFGYINLTRLIYPRMQSRGYGVIINDIGNSGENWDANYIAGSTANAALMAFTRALGGVSLDHGVRVVGVNPGPVETERMVKINKRRALDLYGDESRFEEFKAKFPGGRPASADEVADLMVFLASPRAAYISGTVVTIDGGIAARGSIIKERAVANA